MRYAKEHGTHLIVIETHGRSGLSLVMMGSVAEKIVRTAPCQVRAARSLESWFKLP
jgi:nucleotide-binding universal stress UspA family protein